MARMPWGQSRQTVVENSGGKQEIQTPLRATFTRFLLYATEALYMAIYVPIMVGRLYVLLPSMLLSARIAYGPKDGRQERRESWRAMLYVMLMLIPVIAISLNVFDKLWFPVYWDSSLSQFLTTLMNGQLNAPVTLRIGNWTVGTMGEWVILIRAAMVYIPAYAWVKVFPDIDWRLKIETVLPMVSHTPVKAMSPTAILSPPGFGPLYENEHTEEQEPEPEQVKTMLYVSAQKRDVRPGESLLIAMPDPDIVLADHEEGLEDVGYRRLYMIFDELLANPTCYSRAYWVDERDVLKQNVWRQKFHPWMRKNDIVRNKTSKEYELTEDGKLILEETLTMISDLWEQNDRLQQVALPKTTANGNKKPPPLLEL